MVYKVLSALEVGENTALTIDGNGMGLKNGITISTPEGKDFELLSVGMTAGDQAKTLNDVTSILVGGNFTSKNFYTK